MTRCLDIHTHHPAPQPEGVVSSVPSDFYPIDDQWYSLGYHPWTIADDPTPEQWDDFEKKVSMPFVKAIGECGIDRLKGAPLFRQMLIFNRQIELSEKLEKPLIIHAVRAHDIVVGLKRKLNPKQKWLVHGFRGKPSVAKMMTDVGIYLSFGEFFNPESLKSIPPALILAETDESSLSIEEIISNMSAFMGQDISSMIEENTRRFLNN